MNEENITKTGKTILLDFVKVLFAIVGCFLAVVLANTITLFCSYKFLIEKYPAIPKILKYAEIVPESFSVIDDILAKKAKEIKTENINFDKDILLNSIDYSEYKDDLGEIYPKLIAKFLPKFSEFEKPFIETTTCFKEMERLGKAAAEYMRYNPNASETQLLIGDKINTDILVKSGLWKSINKSEKCDYIVDKSKGIYCKYHGTPYFPKNIFGNANPNFVYDLDKTYNSAHIRKACFSTIRVIQGAVEMYNMDVADMMKKLDFKPLISGGYLKEIPKLPSCPKCSYDSYGDLTDNGFVYCKFHGDLEGRIKIK